MNRISSILLAKYELNCQRKGILSSGGHLGCHLGSHLGGHLGDILSAICSIIHPVVYLCYTLIYGRVKIYQKSFKSYIKKC